MPDTPAQPLAAAPDAQAPQSAERKPWHAPTLTQVALQVTALLSGEGGDKGQSSSSQ
jgi:hypothetical protein